MRNLKRYLAVFISVAMLIAAMAPVALAEETFTYGTQAGELNELGLYKGVSTTSFNPDLKTALDRQTGVTLLVRMGGLEATALAMTKAEIDEALKGFSDAGEIAEWAKPYAAKAVKDGLVVGMTATTFAPDEALTGKQYATMLLRFIGYEVTAENFAEAMNMLKEKGGLTEDMMAFADKALIKDDVVGITYQSLSAIAADGKKVIAKLIEAGAVKREVAEKLGLLGKVASVVAIDGTISVVLTEAPDPAPVVADFTITKQLTVEQLKQLQLQT
jgi:hypothetical protein